jgi:putative DNA primase/helicase
MIDPIQRILERLKNCTGKNGQYEARCPAHDDQRASLSVSRGDDGRVLLCCHANANCTPQTIVNAIGLTMADLFPPKPGGESTNGRRIVATYDYTDEHGALLYQVVRFDPKGFAQRRPDGNGGHVWKLDGIPRVLYRLPELTGQTTIYVVEGEKDADAVRRLHIPATTNAGGAGKWRDEYAAQLKAAGCQHVVVFPDNDPPGEAHGRDVARRCTADGLAVKMIPLPGLPEHGDVSDWLAAGHTRDELAAIVKAAPLWKERLVAQPTPLELTSLAELLGEPEDTLEWIVEDRIPAGSIAAIVAPPKAGKSTLARDLAYAVATGGRWLGWRTRVGAVWYLVLEDKRSEVRKHFRQMGATGPEPIRLFFSPD